MQACRVPGFVPGHPEDVAICRDNRTWLEARGLRFAPRDLANRFSAERVGDPSATFGYHGAWLMPDVLGPERFWYLYQTLDEIGSVVHDRWAIVARLLRGRAGFRRAWRMLLDLARRKQRGGAGVINKGQDE